MRYEKWIGAGFDRWNSGQYTAGQLQAFYDYENSFVLMSGSYRSGKSEIGCRAAIRHLHAFPRAKVGIFRQYQASLKKSTLLTFLELVHPSWVADWSNTDLTLTLKNGATAVFIGAEMPDRLGSIELTFSFVDEASELSDSSLGMIAGRLSGQLDRPKNFDTLPADRQQYISETIDIRQMFLATNPKSTGHHLYKSFIEQPKPSHVAYLSNSISNVNLPETYLINNLSAYVRAGVTIEWVKEQVHAIRAGLSPSDGLALMPKLTPFGQRNLLGQWVAMEGAIYDLDETFHLLDKVPGHWGVINGYYAAVDFGYQNPRLIVASHHYFYQGDRLVDAYAIVEYWAGKEATPDDLLQAMIDADKTYQIVNFYLPHDQPGIAKTAKTTLGAGRVRKAKIAVFAGINLTARFLSSGRLTLLKNIGHELAWKELSGYRWKEDRDGNFLDEPHKENDHYPDAIRYLIASRHLREDLDRSDIEPKAPKQLGMTFSLSEW